MKSELLIAEIDRTDYYKYNGNYRKIIDEGLYLLRDDKFVKHAFNFGHGTMKDFEEYRRNNDRFCVWVDLNTMLII